MKNRLPIDVQRWQFPRGAALLVAHASGVLASASSRSRTFSNRYFSRADVDKSLFRRNAKTSTPEACATQTNREERAIPAGPLQSRRQVNRRYHAARTSAAKFNRRKFKRHEPRIAAQPFALVVGKCSIGAGGKHQQFLSLLIV